MFLQYWPFGGSKRCFLNGVNFFLSFSQVQEYGKIKVLFLLEGKGHDVVVDDDDDDDDEMMMMMMMMTRIWVPCNQ